MGTKDKRPTSTSDPAVAAGDNAVASAKASTSPSTATGSASEVQEFVAKMKSVAPAASGVPGRLVFAMDA
ncbi:MAG: hypothetical protein ACM3L9_04545, partial [Deltaproteobacteria bacterium]